MFFLKQSSILMSSRHLLQYLLITDIDKATSDLVSKCFFSYLKLIVLLYTLEDCSPICLISFSSTAVIQILDPGFKCKLVFKKIVYAL